MGTRTDPVAAAEKLAELDKVRIEERASLKHRNASKYLQEQAKRSKNTQNKEAKIGLNDQLKHHRELLTKHGEAFDDTVEDDPKDTSDAINLNCELLARDQSFEEFNSGYEKYWAEEQVKKSNLKASAEDLEDIFDEAEFDLKQKNKKKIDTLKKAQNGTANEAMEEEVEENPDELIPGDSLNFKVRPDSSDSNIVKINKDLNRNIAKEAESKTLPNVDPDNFINVEPKDIGSDLPEIMGYNELEDDTEDQRDIIAEAFAEDDVVESFKAEKAALIEAKKPKDIDLTLPGWGEWGGGGAAPSKKKRKDENSGHLILNTDKDDKLRTR